MGVEFFVDTVVEDLVAFKGAKRAENVLLAIY